VTTVAHDGGGRVTGVINPYGYGVTQGIAYDVLNRPTWTASSAYADTTRFYYGTLGSDSATVDPKGQTYLSYRNALGWVTSRIVPGSGADSVFYDVAGRPARTRSRAGREVTFAYDSLNRLVKRTGLGTLSVDSMWYDPNGKWVAAQSRVGANVISTDTILTDEQNHLRKVMTNRSTIGAWRVESAFNPDDPGRSSVNLYKRVNNLDSTVTFTSFLYTDAQKRLTYMWSKPDTATFFYNGESLVDSVSLRAGLTETFTHTPNHELSTRGYTGASWVDDLLRRWYHTDSLARITERGGPDSLFQAFGYDSIGRLRSWQKKAERTGVQCVNDTTGYGYTCTGASPWILGAAVTPTYDKVGNPTDLGAVTASGNRLTTFNGVTMTYDPDGNMRTRVTATTTDTLTWDEFGRLVSFKRVPQGQSATVTSFTYDGFGRRVKKTSTSGTVEYLWDGDQIIAEVRGSGSGAVVRAYTYYPGVDQPRSVMMAGETYFTSAEPDGSVNGLIRKSDRTVVAQYKYTPWGELESAGQPSDTVSSLRWKGLPYDAETGLYYMRARYYDPKIRRFISEDPIGLGGGINQYVFASGDPVNGADPWGLDPCDVGRVSFMSSVYITPPASGCTGSPWGDPSAPDGGVISSIAVENTLRKIARSQAGRNGDAADAGDTGTRTAQASDPLNIFYFPAGSVFFIGCREEFAASSLGTSGAETATWEMSVRLKPSFSMLPGFRRVVGYYEGKIATTGSFSKSRKVFPPTQLYRVEGSANCITGEAKLFGYPL
jgi:RHS repeat-associated protein